MAVVLLDELQQLDDQADWNGMLRRLTNPGESLGPLAIWWRSRAYQRKGQQAETLREQVDCFRLAWQNRRDAATDQPALLQKLFPNSWPSRSWAAPAYVKIIESPDSVRSELSQVLHQAAGKQTSEWSLRNAAKKLADIGAPALFSLEALEARVIRDSPQWFQRQLTNSDYEASLQPDIAETIRILREIKQGKSVPRVESQLVSLGSPLEQLLGQFDYNDPVYVDHLDEFDSLKETDLLSMLRESNAVRRAQAAAVLGFQSLVNKDALSALMTLLEDRSYPVRWCALWALGQHLTRGVAALRLNNRCGVEFALRVLRMLREDRSEAKVRPLAADVLGQIARSAAKEEAELRRTVAESLLEALDQPDARIQLAALKSLASLGEQVSRQLPRIEERAQAILAASTRDIRATVDVRLALLELGRCTADLIDSHLPWLIQLIRSDNRGERMGGVVLDDRRYALCGLLLLELADDRVVRLLVERLWMDASRTIAAIARQALVRLLDPEEAARAGVFDVEV